MENIQKELAIRIQEEYGLRESNAQIKAAEILDRCPVQLRPNVYEWMEGRPLSDIFIEKLKRNVRSGGCGGDRI